jgi:hypothetical protein
MYVGEGRGDAQGKVVFQQIFGPGRVEYRVVREYQFFTPSAYSAPVAVTGTTTTPTQPGGPPTHADAADDTAAHDIADEGPDRPHGERRRHQTMAYVDVTVRGTAGAAVTFT